MMYLSAYLQYLGLCHAHKPSQFNALLKKIKQNYAIETQCLNYLNQTMQAAYQLALQAQNCNEVPVGAVIIHRPTGKIIAGQHNKTVQTGNITHHAELLALQDACASLNNYRLNDCDLFCTLEPCPMCMGAIIHARIAHVFYACSDVKTGACGGLINLCQTSFNHHTIALNFEDLLNKFDLDNLNELENWPEICKDLLQKFFKQKRL